MIPPDRPAPLRVLLVDDQGLVRAGFGVILDAQPDIEVVGEAADGLEAVEQARRLRPDVVLMDVRMPRMDGIEATRRVLAEGAPSGGPGGGAGPRGSGTLRRPRVLILTTFDLDEYVYQALKAGASGFLLKDAPRAELVRAVRVVAAGETLLAPVVTRRLVEAYTRAPDPLPPASAPALDRLTARERETLALLARGCSNAEIARAFVVSDHTVKTHVSNVLAKLGLRDRVHAVIAAYELGVVAPGSPPAR